MHAHPSQCRLLLVLSAVGALSGCSSNEGLESNPAPTSTDCQTETITLVSSGVEGNILVDDTSIYWRGPSSEIFALDKEGGEPRLLAPASPDIKNRTLGMDATTLYWTEQTQGRIMRLAKQGGEAGILVEQLGSPLDVATDETHVYWTDMSSGSIGRVKKDGSGLETVAQGAWDPILLALDQTDVYFRTLDGRVMDVPKEGGEATEIANEGEYGNGSLGGLAVDADAVVWGEWNNRRVVLWDKTKRTTKLVADNQRAPNDVVLAGDLIFWVNAEPTLGSHEDTVRRASKTAEGCSDVVCGQDFPTSLAIDSERLYWNSSGSLQSTAR